MTCQHDDTEDCMFCSECGECREDLDDDDVCPDCQDPPLFALENDELLEAAGEMLNCLIEIRDTSRDYLRGNVNSPAEEMLSRVANMAGRTAFRIERRRYAAEHVCDDDCRSNGCPNGRG